MFANLALLSLAVLSTSTVRDPSLYRPRVELWTNRADAAVYTRGERVRLYFRLDQDAYVTVFRVDTDGRIRVLFPEIRGKTTSRAAAETSKSMGMSSPARPSPSMTTLALATSSRWPPLIRSSTIKSKADSTGTIASSPMVAYAVIRMWL